jgi:hypothetical protein
MPDRAGCAIEDAFRADRADLRFIKRVHRKLGKTGAGWGAIIWT